MICHCCKPSKLNPPLAEARTTPVKIVYLKDSLAEFLSNDSKIQQFRSLEWFLFYFQLQIRCTCTFDVNFLCEESGLIMRLFNTLATFYKSKIPRILFYKIQKPKKSVYQRIYNLLLSNVESKKAFVSGCDVLHESAV